LEGKKRYHLKNILLAAFWIALGGATVFLLASSIRSKGTHPCKGVEINIHGVSNNFFVDKKDILNAITESESANPVGKTTRSFNLKKLEDELEKNVWIKAAELFFDNNEILKVMVQEREPIARVFTTTAATFYIDNDLTMLPLSDKFSARLPVFTGFPSDKKILSKADSSLLTEIKAISLALQKDSFSMAMIEQVDINAQRMFEMIPKIGNQLIVFGNAGDVDAKLQKLKMFYKEIMVKAGWNNYSIINLQYKNQVVAKRKGAEDIAADSLRTLQIMQQLAAKTQQQANDSLQQIIQPDNNRNTVDSTMIQQSIQRDDNDEPAAVEIPDNSAGQSATQPVVNNPKPAAAKLETKPASKPVQKPTVVIKKPVQMPKAVINNKNEY
jgi:cell division protein FtsQ